jgi:hypothetical protein
MKIERLEIADIALVTPARHGFFFSEAFRADATYVQDNHAFSGLCLTARGAPGSRMTFKPANLNGPNKSCSQTEQRH